MTPGDPSPALPRRAVLGGALVAGSTGLVVARPGWAVGAPPAQGRGDRPRLTHGVQSGDVRTTRGAGGAGGAAVLWSRADRPSRLLVEVSRDPSFRRARTVRGPVVTPRTDLTGEIPLTGLPTGVDLHYRVRAVDLDDPRRSSRAERGRLRTAPGPRDDVRFLWSGDIAGQGWGVNPDLGGFRIAEAMIRRRADFFLCSGDNVYADGPLETSVALPDGATWRNVVTEAKTAVAQTLEDFRGQYRYNLLADNWREFLARTPQVSQWDDHEVTNNWYPGEVLDDDRYDEKRVDVLARRAHRAFHDYVPVADISPDEDGRVYRVIHYGPHLDLFVLDMRTRKNPNTGNREPDPDGGLLGDRQVRWLLEEAGRSRATWKVIAADLPIGLVVPDGETAQEGAAQGDDGRPLGREVELARVLSGFRRRGVRNHVWLTADVHYTAAHHYSPDRAAYDDFDPFWEFVSGPLNAGAFGPNELDATFGPRADFVAAAPHPNTSPAEGAQFFGEVQLDARTEQLSVVLRDVDGRALYRRTLDPRR